CRAQHFRSRLYWPQLVSLQWGFLELDDEDIGPTICPGRSGGNIVTKGRRAQNRNLPLPSWTLVSLKFADSSLIGNFAGSTRTIVSPKWKIRIRRDHTLSV